MLLKPCSNFLASTVEVPVRRQGWGLGFGFWVVASFSFEGSFSVCAEGSRLRVQGSEFRVSGVGLGGFRGPKP